MVNNGGPAFPGMKLNIKDNERPPNMFPVDGMSLRDHFAAKAMQGILSADHDISKVGSDIVSVSYQFADAMLKERDK